jgi:hypothetical protein
VLVLLQLTVDHLVVVLQILVFSVIHFPFYFNLSLGTNTFLLQPCHSAMGLSSVLRNLK